MRIWLHSTWYIPASIVRDPQEPWHVISLQMSTVTPNYQSYFRRLLGDCVLRKVCCIITQLLIAVAVKPTHTNSTNIWQKFPQISSTLSPEFVIRVSLETLAIEYLKYSRSDIFFQLSTISHQYITTQQYDTNFVVRFSNEHRKRDNNQKKNRIKMCVQHSFQCLLRSSGHLRPAQPVFNVLGCFAQSLPQHKA